MAIKEHTPATEFEKMLMWTSYRYCIGRKSYVVTMADEIALNFAYRLDRNERLSTAKDIRRTIAEQLKFLHCNFSIENGWAINFDPLKVLFEFFQKEKISSTEQLANYAEIIYDARTQKYYHTKRKATHIKQYISATDFDDLLPWARLANIFDSSTHRRLYLVDDSQCVAFPDWERDCEFVGNDKFGRQMYTSAPFGWHLVYKPLADFLNGNKRTIIPADTIKRIEEL